MVVCFHRDEEGENSWDQVESITNLPKGPLFYDTYEKDMGLDGKRVYYFFSDTKLSLAMMESMVSKLW